MIRWLGATVASIATVFAFAADVGTAESCAGDSFVLRFDDRLYASTSSPVPGYERGRALARVGVSVCGERIGSTRVLRIRGVHSASAVVAKDGDGRRVVYVRRGDLPQLRSHPVHALLYAQDGPPQPSGCSRRRFRLVGVVRHTPTVHDLLVLKVDSAERGAPLNDDEAVAGIVRSTVADLARRHGAPYVKRGMTLIGEVSPCRGGFNVYRSVRVRR